MRESERERELCFPGLFLEGRRQDAAAPPMGPRAADFAPLRFAAPCFLRGVAAAEKSAEKEATARERATAIGSALAFLRFSRAFKGPMAHPGPPRKERPRNR